MTEQDRGVISILGYMKVEGKTPSGGDYIEAFPKDFKSAVDQLKKKNKVSNAKLAEIWNMDDSTFARILDDPRRYRNEDFLTLLCLCFKTPDWISRLLFRRQDSS